MARAKWQAIPHYHLALAGFFMIDPFEIKEHPER
jgi:hypothetical protein